MNGLATRQTKVALGLLIAALSLPTTATSQRALAKLSAELRNKDILVRLKAIDGIVASGDATAERTLQPLLRDKDWEVQEYIAQALGKLKSKSSLTKLVALAIDGDIVRVRNAAATAAAIIDPVDAAERIFKKAKSKRLVRALEALALVLRARPAFEDADKLEELLSHKDAAVREAATAAWLETAPSRSQALAKLNGSRHLAVRCRALDTITAAPRAEDIDPLTELFIGKGEKPVVARRIVRALAASLVALDDDRVARAKQVLENATSGEVPLTRRALLVELLCRGEKPIFDQETGVAALRPSLRSQFDRSRATAARVLREIGGKDALKAALSLFERETSGSSQLQLVETVAALRETKTKQAVEWLAAIVAGNYDEEVRERAVVRLGRSGAPGATRALVAALSDDTWTIAVCAAVSLGKTDADDALAPLLKLLENDDWKMRGAAVVGLMHWSRDAAVNPLIRMLDDDHPVVARAAHEALRTMSRNFDGKLKASGWRKWWTANRKTHDFTDREATLDKLNKYGYAVPDSEVYLGLDVVVFTSRGDHIEQLLDRLKIAYRTTHQGDVLEGGVHPEAIFVSNCTGELLPDDVDPLAWFVRTGGSLFGSCWSLTETIARVHPGVMKIYATPQQVMDDVRAMPCRPDSPLLTGVFPPAVVPVYHLEGSHLIQVLDPNRCEVLIDSPDAAERHGCGNLAAWFFSGHGVLFDSANHFDLQGLGVAGAGALKKPKDRQAYAVDHLGMSLATWRKVRKEGYWKSNSKASESVPDMSAFRLLTNFVRSKRMGNY